MESGADLRRNHILLTAIKEGANQVQQHFCSIVPVFLSGFDAFRKTATAQARGAYGSVTKATRSMGQKNTGAKAQAHTEYE